MLTISKINKFEQLKELEKDWNPLLDKSQTNTIFLSYEWISNWWNCFGQDKELFVLLIKKQDKLIGIAPLMLTTIKKFGIAVKKIEFIGMPLSDYADFIITEDNPAVLKKIFEYLKENKNLWSYVILNQIPENSPTLALKNQLSNGLLDVNESNVCPTLVFDADWEEKIKKINSRNMRRRIRQFEPEGLSFSRCNGNAKDALKILEIYFKQHKQRWNQTNTPSMFNNGAHKKFFKDVLVSLMKIGKADLFYLNFKEKTIAIRINFFDNNKLLDYNSSYDLSYRKQSPGIISIKYILDYCVEHGLEEFDFLRGGEKHKFRYSNKIKQNYVISLHKNHLLNLLDNFSRKMEKKIKQNERLYNFFIKYEKLRIF